MDRSPLADSDGSRAIQDMILAAWSQGVGSNWAGFNSLPEVNPLLGIPEGVSILAILPFGYPAEAVGKGQKKRKPLGEVAYNERWGDRKSTRLNSSHQIISYAVFCLKKKKRHAVNS